MDVLTIYDGNDGLIEVKGLLDGVTGEYVSDATLEVTLRDAAGAEVAGQVWPLSMEYVPDTSGVYRATLLATLDLTLNARYVATITADGGPGLAAQWDVDVVCRKRRS